MIRTAQWARENNVPYFGICLGLQVMVVEYARNVMGLDEADSTEFMPETPHPVVSLLEEQINVKNYGGTMRLGANDTLLYDGYKIREIYGRERISERHRHRYEVSNLYRERLHEAGLRVAGVTPDAELVESVQWQGHAWGIGVQFHPEFKSKPVSAHPLFQSFIAASYGRQRTRARRRAEHVDAPAG
jgi:CTP synthase